MDLGVPPKLELRLATLVSRVGVPTAMLYGRQVLPKYPKLHSKFPNTQKIILPGVQGIQDRFVSARSNSNHDGTSKHACILTKCLCCLQPAVGKVFINSKMKQLQSSPGLEPDVHPVGVGGHHMLQHSSTSTKLQTDDGQWTLQSPETCKTCCRMKLAAEGGNPQTVTQVARGATHGSPSLSCQTSRSFEELHTRTLLWDLDLPT